MPPNETNPASRAAIYARYSSDNQSEASIEDQIRICRAEIERQGFELVRVCGASTLRPG